MLIKFGQHEATVRALSPHLLANSLYMGFMQKIIRAFHSLQEIYICKKKNPSVKIDFAPTLFEWITVGESGIVLQPPPFLANVSFFFFFDVGGCFQDAFSVRMSVGTTEIGVPLSSPAVTRHTVSCRKLSLYWLNKQPEPISAESNF
jgi:hypothetical protein